MKVGADAPRGRARGGTYPYRHHHHGRGVPGSTDVIDDMGLRVDYSRVGADVLERASRRGTLVHRYAACHLNGATLPWVSADAAPYVNSLLRGLRVWRIEPILVEVPVVHEASPLYAVTLDLFCLWDALPVFVDWKTRPGVAGDGLQLAAAQHAVATAYPQHRETALRARRMTVELRKNGTFPKLHPHDDPTDARVFLSAAVVWHWRIAQGWVPEKR